MRGVDSGEAVRGGVSGVRGNCLYFLFNFAVNLKMLSKESVIKMVKGSEHTQTQIDLICPSRHPSYRGGRKGPEG